MFFLYEVMRDIKSSQWPYYVYCLYKPDGTIFYVGKGTARRKKDERITYHEYEARLDKTPDSNPYVNHLKINIIRKIWKSGGEVFYAIDSWHKEELNAYMREKELIQSTGRKIFGEGPLSNITEGGEKEIAALPDEVKYRISESLKQYFLNNPNAMENLKQQGAEFWIDNDEAREEARRRAIENKSHEFIIKWREKNPEEFNQNCKQHSEFMKQWYADNSDEAQALAERRNKILKSKDHRIKMSDLTSSYLSEHPEVVATKVEQLTVGVQELKELRKKSLEILRDKLVEVGEIGYCDPTPKKLMKWRKSGLVKKYCPNFPTGRSNKEGWISFLR